MRSNSTHQFTTVPESNALSVGLGVRNSTKATSMAGFSVTIRPDRFPDSVEQELA